MKNLYFTKMLLIFLVACSLGSPSVAMEDDIKTNVKYRIISKTGVILSPHDLKTRPLTGNGNFNDFCFEFSREGANSYRINSIRNGKKSSVLNVIHAFWPCGDKSVKLRRDDNTWKRHRTFRATKNAEGYYEFINEESKTQLGIDTKTGRLKAFHTSGNSQEDKKLFRIEDASLPLWALAARATKLYEAGKEFLENVNKNPVVKLGKRCQIS